MIHLELKDKTDYSGLDYRIAEKIYMDDISWFPVQGSD